VLAAFGADARVCDATDAAVVGRALDAALDRLAAERFGDRPLPAVLLQLEQLRRRLAAFAGWQAQRAADGWRIEACEWSPKERVILQCKSGPVELRGRIDRIDVYADEKRWALLDYKTVNEPKSPGTAHRAKDGTWRDLQLPLYELLARSFAAEHACERPPLLGYVVLPRDAVKTGELMADWPPDFVEEAQEQARSLVDEMRAQGFERLGDFPEDDPQLAALAGIGLLAEPDEEGGAEGAGQHGEEEAA
jgi:RecB family exonuclease